MFIKLNFPQKHSLEAKLSFCSLFLSIWHCSKHIRYIYYCKTSMWPVFFMEHRRGHFSTLLTDFTHDLPTSKYNILGLYVRDIDLSLIHIWQMHCFWCDLCLKKPFPYTVRHLFSAISRYELNWQKALLWGASHIVLITFKAF